MRLPRPTFLFLFSVIAPVVFMTTDLSLINFRIDEGISPGTYVGNLAKSAPVRRLLGGHTDGARFELFPSSDSGAALFDVAARTGIVTTAGPVDREKVCRQGETHCLVTLHVQLVPPDPEEAKEGAESTVKPAPSLVDGATSTILRVQILIADVNDNAPEFGSRQAELQVPENSPVGAIFALQPAQDADTPVNGVSDYALNATDGVFGLIVRKNPNSDTQRDPLLQQKKPLDRETVPYYTYTLTARDKDNKKGQLVVRVQLVDVNDNAPRWEKAPYSVEMSECKPLGEPLLRVKATDADEGINGRVTYQIAAAANPRIHQMFYMNGDNLHANENPDYEKEHKVVVPLVAEDGGRLQSTTKVEITVIDCNDHRPTISVRGRSGANPRIPENIQTARLVATLVVADGDSGENGRTACSIDATSHFELREVAPSPMPGDSRQGSSRTQYYDLLTLAGADFDRERHPRHHVSVTCRDFGAHPLTNKRTLVVEVTDQNDNPPMFARAIIRLRVSENNRPGDLVGSVRAIDPDFGSNGLVTYRLESVEEPEKVNGSEQEAPKKGLSFRIDMQGNLRALTRFDRETRERYRLRVIATDNGRPRKLSATALVIVSIADVNDNPPRFPKANFRFEVREAKGTQRLPSSLLGRLNASDPDSGGNGSLRYSIADFLPPHHCRHCFTIDSDGALRVSGRIDRERVPSYRFRVVAYDQGSPIQLSGSAWVHVTVLDLNDNKPKLLFPAPAINDTVQIEADTPAGHQVRVVHVQN